MDCSQDISLLNYIETYKGYKITSLFRYDNVIKEIISLFKFQRELKLAKTISNIFIENLDFKDYDFITPVPSHFFSDLIRGFSTMEHIAKLISEKTNIDYKTIIKRKLFPIKYKKRMNKEKRFKNKVFKLCEKKIIKDKNILIIDDISTTNSTIKECIDLIAKEKPKRIDALILAKKVIV